MKRRIHCVHDLDDRGVKCAKVRLDYVLVAVNLRYLCWLYVVL